MSQVFEEEPPVPHFYPEGCYFNELSDIAGKKILVMGLGLNGGGEAAVRFFLRHGAYVLVTDMKTEEQLAPTIKSLSEDKTLDHSKLSYRLGTHCLEDFIEADCVIKNPGIKYDGNKFLEAAKAIETDISIFLHFSKAPVIAVTGSKGKSSTVSAIYYGLKQAGFEAFLGGNITVSPLTFLEKTNGTTPVVLELSSWQLADLRGRKALKPHISLITKIIPDHQNFYHSMLSYVADKELIFADQTKDDFAIFDFDDDSAADGGTLIENWGNIFAKQTKATVLRYSRKKLPEGVFGVWQDKKGDGVVRLPKKFMSRYAQTHGKDSEVILKELMVPGKHMRLNVLNAALVLKLMGISPDQIIDILGRWNGIEHRLEYFHTWETAGVSGVVRSVKFYNDSASTVGEAAGESTQAFGTPVIFITGGTDKGLDLSVIADTISRSGAIKPHSIYLLKGSATDKIILSFQEKQIPYFGPFDSLELLLTELKENLKKAPLSKDETVVFSPGSTSFGMFKNEFHRGKVFKETVCRIFGN